MGRHRWSVKLSLDQTCSGGVGWNPREVGVSKKEGSGQTFVDCWNCTRPEPLGNLVVFILFYRALGEVPLIYLRAPSGGGEVAERARVKALNS